MKRVSGVNLNLDFPKIFFHGWKTQCAIQALNHHCLIAINIYFYVADIEKKIIKSKYQYSLSVIRSMGQSYFSCLMTGVTKNHPANP